MATEVVGGRIRLAAIDDHEIVLSGLRALVSRRDRDLELIASATSVAHLIEALAGRAVDLVLVDLELADGLHIERVAAELAPLGARLVAYTASSSPVPLRRAVAAGCMGIALKSDPEEALLETIVTVAGGNFAVSSELARALSTDERAAPLLAPRELEALRLLALGMPRKAVGRQMSPQVREATVTTYLNRVAERYRELGREVSGTTAILRELAVDGYINPGARDDDAV